MRREAQRAARQGRTQGQAQSQESAASPRETSAAPAQPLDERQLARDQWLRRIPDDPGELLRRKFRYYYQRQRHEAPPQNPW